MTLTGSPPNDVALFFSSRLFITTMCFLGVLFMVTARLNMSVAIVCMVNHTATRASDKYDLTRPNKSGSYVITGATNITFNVQADDEEEDHVSFNDQSSECGSGNTNNSEAVKPDGPFQWSKQEQGAVLGAYFWGYVLFQIPSGWTVRKFGSVRMLAFSAFLSSVICLLTPLLAHCSYLAVAVTRAFTGSLAGMVCPAVHNLLSNWLPPTERAKMGSYAYSGFPFGALVTFTGSGLLCEYGFADGWQSIFYVYGGLGMIFALTWSLLVSETPASHKYISPAEKNFIQSNVDDIMKEGKTLDTPWRAILTSLPVYAILFSSIANDFFGIIMWLFLPMYLSDVLNFDISSNGVISSLPYALQFITSLVFGFISDAMLKRAWLSIGALRKLFCSSGKVICIAAVIAVGFLDCHHASLAVMCLVISIGAMGLLTLGYYVNPMDIAPVYSGLIIAMANTLGTVTGLVSPHIVSSITGDNPSRESWQIIFLISAAVIATALVFYARFASGEVQPWAQRQAFDHGTDAALEITETNQNSELNSHSVQKNDNIFTPSSSHVTLLE